MRPMRRLKAEAGRNRDGGRPVQERPADMKFERTSIRINLSRGSSGMCSRVWRAMCTIQDIVYFFVLYSVYTIYGVRMAERARTAPEISMAKRRGGDCFFFFHVV